MIHKILFFLIVIISLFYCLLPRKIEIENFTPENCYYLKMENKFLSISSEDNNSYIYLDNKYNRNKKPIYYDVKNNLFNYQTNLNMAQSQKFNFIYTGTTEKGESIYMIKTKEKPFLYLKAKSKNEISASLIGGSSDQYWIIDSNDDGVSIESYKFRCKFLARKSKVGGYLFPERRGTVYLSNKRATWNLVNCIGRINPNIRSTNQNLMTEDNANANANANATANIDSNTTTTTTTSPPLKCHTTTSIPPTSIPPTSTPMPESLN